jgi:hypothetical protein
VVDPETPVLLALSGRPQVVQVEAPATGRPHPAQSGCRQHVRYDLLQIAAEPGLTMITYTAEPLTGDGLGGLGQRLRGPGRRQARSHNNLPLLASWAAGQDHTTAHRVFSTLHVTPPSHQE